MRIRSWFHKKTEWIHCITIPHKCAKLMKWQSEITVSSSTYTKGFTETGALFSTHPLDTWDTLITVRGDRAGCIHTVWRAINNKQDRPPSFEGRWNINKYLDGWEDETSIAISGANDFMQVMQWHHNRDLVIIFSPITTLSYSNWHMRSISCSEVIKSHSTKAEVEAP